MSSSKEKKSSAKPFNAYMKDKEKQEKAKIG